MFKKSIFAALAASVLGLGMLTTAPVTANAASVELRLGGHERGPAVIVRDRDRRYSDRDRRHFDNDRHYRRANICQPNEAVREARRNGVHNAQVKRINDRLIIVDGRKRGQKINIAFNRIGGHCDIAWVKKDRRGYRF